MKVLRCTALVLAAALAVLPACSRATQPPPRPVAKPSAPVRIQFWHGLSYESSHGKVLRQLVAEFNQTQTEVIVEETYQGSYADLEKKLTVAFNAGQAPAVVQATDSMLINLVSTKMVAPLDELVPQAELADYPHPMLQSATFDQQVYALPFNKSAIVLIYDKQKVPTPPRTWAEFRESAKRNSGPDKFGTVFAADVYQFGNYFIQAGGAWLSEGRAAFDSPAGAQALTFMRDMVREGSAGLLKPKEYASDYFNRGQAAMIMTTSASYAFIRPASGSPWGAAMLPAGPMNDLTTLAGANVSVVAGQKPETARAAARFITWLTGRDGTLRWATARTGYMPVRKSAIASPVWQAFIQNYPEYAVLGEAQAKLAPPMPTHRRWFNVQKEITAAVERVMLGQVPPDIALAMPAEKANEFLGDR